MSNNSAILRERAVLDVGRFERADRTCLSSAAAADARSGRRVLRARPRMCVQPASLPTSGPMKSVALAAFGRGAASSIARRRRATVWPAPAAGASETGRRPARYRRVLRNSRRLFQGFENKRILEFRILGNESLEISQGFDRWCPDRRLEAASLGGAVEGAGAAGQSAPAAASRTGEDLAGAISADAGLGEASQASRWGARRGRRSEIPGRAWLPAARP